MGKTLEKYKISPKKKATMNIFFVEHGVDVDCLPLVENAPFSTKMFSTTCFQLCSNCKYLHLKIN
jgi:hypothetical protein